MKAKQDKQDIETLTKAYYDNYLSPGLQGQKLRNFELRQIRDSQGKYGNNFGEIPILFLMLN
ncbi:MAG: hypothetical protein ABI472_22265 [Ginsengibacter sp.]